MIENWESIGIDEGWIENEWTEEQMMDRIAELGLMDLPLVCTLDPYYLNFLQNPDTNTSVKETVNTIREETARIGKNDAAWIAASNLWTPGQTINIVFSNQTAQEFIRVVLIKDLQPHVSMKLAFPGGTTGDILVDVAPMAAGMGGYSKIGRTGGQQTINLNSEFMGDASVSALTSTRSFNWARYIVNHEFGHAMGLWHEWDREKCDRNGVKCSPVQDPYSVMNYPSRQMSKAAKPNASTMDRYSPEDVKWLQSVYKGVGLPDQPPPAQPDQPPPAKPPDTGAGKKTSSWIIISGSVGGILLLLLIIIGIAISTKRAQSRQKQP